MRRLGVIGTMVWDTIWREPQSAAPLEEWGGINYALAAADAVRLLDLQVVPLIKLGRDLADRGFQFLRELSVIETDETVAVVDAANPRVELHYRGGERRCERLTGRLPAWSWTELKPRVEGCDALYVNFITGDELDLRTAQELRCNFSGPIYADIHSLMLATGPQGDRRPRQLARWSEWFECFDAVQVNEDELATLAANVDDPWAFAARVVGRETGLLLVTLGAGGAAYVTMAETIPLGSAESKPLDGKGPVFTRRLAVEAEAEGDPTGCGDVWGMTVFCALMAGRDLEEAVRLANSAARANVRYFGASGLNRFLRSEFESA